MYQNRAEAGHKLARRLLPYGRQNPAIVALPRGGVPVGYEVACQLSAPLDVLVVRKLGFPGQPELAIGAIADGDHPETVLNSEMFNDVEVPARHIEREIAAKLNEIQKMEGVFRNHRPAINLTGRVVIVVDDGIATGATVRVAIKRIRREKPKKIVVATPVASHEAIQMLQNEADEIVCLDIPEYFGAVGGFYRDFGAVSTEEVVKLLDESFQSEATNMGSNQ